MDTNKVYALLMIEEKTRNHPSLTDLHNAAMDELIQLNAEEVGPTVVKDSWPPPNRPRGQVQAGGQSLSGNISEPKEPKGPPHPAGPFQGNPAAANKETEDAS